MGKSTKRQRKTDNLPLKDEIRIVRGLIMGFDGQISFESGRGMLDGRFEKPDDARKVFELVQRLIPGIAIDLIDEHVVSIRLQAEP